LHTARPQRLPPPQPLLSPPLLLRKLLLLLLLLPSLPLPGPQPLLLLLLSRWYGGLSDGALPSLWPASRHPPEAVEALPLGGGRGSRGGGGGGGGGMAGLDGAFVVRR
jgi:hypothetical protein